ncbi:S9 family peptidase [Histomonas meleagridis]|uniref:S9 family peptidase n=1 Tax=Histomonas meleagridis TaxID=135588 RepID=UPI00355A319D|nr:S9 family peptidase [Histomonas meleagridis]KAH0798538.1 S9 family peptidase [Histomonas meleagridis]
MTLIDFTKNEIIWSQSIPSDAENEDWCKVTRNLAYTKDNNLYVITSDGVTHQVTNEPAGIVCGKSVHRNEFGIEKGTFWSPKGTLLAFYRMDETMVTDYPQIDTNPRVSTNHPFKYPMAGMTSHKVTIGIYDPATDKTIYLDLGDPTDRYFTNISWSPNEKQIYLIELNRDQNHSKLMRFNVEDGKFDDILIEEINPKYVEPLHPIVFLPWDDEKFLYQSRIDGFNHIYLCDTNMKPNDFYKMKQITKGEYEVTEFVGFIESTKEIIIISNEISPIQDDIFAISLENYTKRRINKNNGTHKVNLSQSGEYLIDLFSSYDFPYEVQLISTLNDDVNLHLNSNISLYKLKFDIEIGTIKAADDKTDLYYRLIKPFQFDPTKKYPVIVYVYGGPHSQLVRNRRDYNATDIQLYLSLQNYIIFTVDNRGTSKRGFEFESVTFHHLGVEEVKDQYKGIEFLKTLDFIDENRIGIYGWSYGGFMTINMMLSYPNAFKVGVAGGPVIDWKYYEVMYGERYMGTPQNNEEGYNESNLCRKVSNLNGKLQIIIGGKDDICVPQHTMQFISSCISCGKQIDLFIYPNDKHGVGLENNEHLYQRIVNYFNQYLG